MAKKEKTQREHARRRIMQRFDVVLSDFQMGEIVNKIQSNQFKLILSESNRVGHYRGYINNIECEIVYDRNRKQLITAWPVGEKPFIY